MADITIKINCDSADLSHKCDQADCPHLVSWCAVGVILETIKNNLATSEGWVTQGEHDLRDGNDNTVGTYTLEV